MRKIVVFDSVTLDGVMQAPAHPDEDRRGGFESGGWALPYADQVMVEAMQERSAGPASPVLLLGRRTYEHFASVWPDMPEDNPYTTVINNMRKYVASATLQEPLSWHNSTVLEGDTIDAVAKLEEQPGGDIVILGSGELVQSLMRHGLIDEYVLLIHPLVLGSGRRLFPDGGAPATLQLAGTTTTTTGVIIAAYRTAGTSAASPS